jgi:hypothetical protein
MDGTSAEAMALKLAEEFLRKTIGPRLVPTPDAIGEAAGEMLAAMRVRASQEDRP